MCACVCMCDVCVWVCDVCVWVCDVCVHVCVYVRVCVCTPRAPISESPECPRISENMIALEDLVLMLSLIRDAQEISNLLIVMRHQDLTKAVSEHQTKASNRIILPSSSETIPLMLRFLNAIGLRMSNGISPCFFASLKGGV